MLRTMCVTLFAVIRSVARRLSRFALNRHVAMLAGNPLLAVEQAAFNPPVRLFTSGKHTIVYTHQGHNIWVVRFLHRRMDIKHHL